MRKDPSMRGQIKKTVRTLLALGASSSVLVAGGCVSYTNVAGPESPPSFRSPNHFAATDVTGVALDWVIRRHGPKDGSGYVVNLGSGTTQENAMDVFAQIPSGAVWPSSVEQDPTGMFHVGRVWIRASEAKVDIVHPFDRLDGSTGQRGVTVWLQGGVRKWRAIRGQYWAPGTVQVPVVSVPWAELDGEVQPAALEPQEPRRDVQGSQEVEDVRAPVPEVESEPAPVVEPVSSEPVESTGGSALWREVPVGDG